ncbi:thiamine pyrophosphate-dependent enzyme [Faecalicatena contorta]|uniref:2-oxoglutarate ferredoxin oxidoreductase subunit beta n=1 Tax=Faecalicatena contorta TaxID=39482 RepID=A0A315ZWH5_9FIRM|nr:thiamine pyrophosphate-dependent enzyme [Faecalicatena contorta]PWJ49603.1 2-oxoglutarate ferredoxin oxidoreductase subunit beta [Faecalicatena contorta]SUQ14321.1 2-oxoglutarate ferredoxin oxidoreductase subunit beta [Faecalicatena contorta]
MGGHKFDTYETAWCPGCGNFSILNSLQKTLEELKKDPHDVLIVGGIGQAAKTPQYISANSFCGLHGRAVPPAVAAKIVNPNLTVIINSGDGDSYGEGGNHFIHNIRRNVDIAHFIHDNQVYGLTKGQASPTADEGAVNGVQVDGNNNIPFNPVLMAIASGAGFVARSFSGKPQHMEEMMKRAILFKGYAMVDILQPCVSFNKVNTFGWYNKRVYELDNTHDAGNRLAAMERAMEFGDRIPIGVLYEKEQPTYHEKHPSLKDGQVLVAERNDPALIDKYMQEMV